MTRQIKQVEEAMIRHGVQRSPSVGNGLPYPRRATDRLAEADSYLLPGISDWKVLEADLGIKVPWWKRVNWTLVGVIIAALGMDLGLVVFLIWSIEKIARVL